MLHAVSGRLCGLGRIFFRTVYYFFLFSLHSFKHGAKLERKQQMLEWKGRMDNGIWVLAAKQAVVNGRGQYPFLGATRTEGWITSSGDY